MALKSDLNKYRFDLTKRSTNQEETFEVSHAETLP